MLCPKCHSAGCEEDCVDYCLNCDEEIEAGKEFCSKECKKEFNE